MNPLLLLVSRCAIVATLLATALIPVKEIAAADPPAPIKALVVLGGCCHDYKTQQNLLVKGLAERAHVQVTVAYDPDTTTGHLNPVYQNPDWAADFDMIIHDECSSNIKDLSIIDRILAPHRAGLPAVLLHCGMHSYRSEGYPQAITPWFEFTGLQSTGHGPQAPIDIVFETAANPITRGFTNWTTINEELYNNSSGKLLDTATALARGRQTTRSKEGEQKTNDYVVAWTNNYRGTKVFATTLGHNNQTVADPRYLDLVTRGVLWSCGKLNETYLKR